MLVFESNGFYFLSPFGESTGYQAVSLWAFFLFHNLAPVGQSPSIPAILFHTKTPVVRELPAPKKLPKNSAKATFLGSFLVATAPVFGRAIAPPVGVDLFLVAPLCFAFFKVPPPFHALGCYVASDKLQPLPHPRLALLFRPRATITTKPAPSPLCSEMSGFVVIVLLITPPLLSKAGYKNNRRNTRLLFLYPAFISYCR